MPTSACSHSHAIIQKRPLTRSEMLMDVFGAFAITAVITIIWYYHLGLVYYLASLGPVFAYKFGYLHALQAGQRDRHALCNKLHVLPNQVQVLAREGLRVVRDQLQHLRESLEQPASVPTVRELLQARYFAADMSDLFTQLYELIGLHDAELKQALDSFNSFRRTLPALPRSALLSVTPTRSAKDSLNELATQLQTVSTSMHERLEPCEHN